MSITEYSNLQKNKNLLSEFQKLNDERFEFFNSLTEKQTKTLDRIILNILDSTAFNFLREIEESLDENKSVGMTINGNKIENIRRINNKTDILIFSKTKKPFKF
ncbi:hypothetical protein BTO07_02140 [Polaribacter sp. SA4-12]|nr:hypothetical protein BTO07_02140 [Polaribacter sp. SA4-12]